jgi:VWFA-related protein
MSFENLTYVREALKKFIAEQIEPTDLVAVSLTGSRTGALAQFSTNKDLLNAAVDRIRWSNLHRARPLDAGFYDRQFSDNKRGQTIRERNLAVATLGSLKYTLKSMEDLPGRKSVILVSEGFRLGYDELEGVGGAVEYTLDSLNQVMTAAHRSGAVIYSVDPRGGESLGLHPRDDLSGVVRLAQEVQEEVLLAAQTHENVWAAIEQRQAGGRRLQTMAIEDIKMLLDPESFAKISSVRMKRFYQTQEGLNFLPVSTGGLYLKYNNEISQNLSEILEDQQGYYLIGYAADSKSLLSNGSRRFPRIKVAVEPSGLNVRGRATFMGTVKGEKDPTEPTPEERMHQLMSSPFGSGDVGLELTSLYERDGSDGAFLSSWVYVDAKDLNFIEEDGWKSARVEVWAAAFCEKPTPVKEQRETYAVRVRGQSYRQLLQEGLVCRVRLPVKKAGPYQLRAVVHDEISGKMGSASRFIRVPDLSDGRLALSGIVVRGTPLEAQNQETVQEDMALRRFSRGTLLNYALYIYNAQLDRRTDLPELETQVRLFREGRQIYEGQVRAFELEGQQEEGVLVGSGYLELGSRLNTGHYAMQYTVTDKLASSGHQTASQWIDFKVME